MAANRLTTRRAFLKTSAASAAGIAAAGVFPQAVSARSGEWAPGLQINPDIDNLTVVSCKDTRYFSTIPLNTSFKDVNAAINDSVVTADMDEMAKALVRKKYPGATAAEAWKKIFQKPANKDFSAATVAFKVNTLEPNLLPSVAVINKIAEELNRLGVPYVNMIIYDGLSNTYVKYTEDIGGVQKPLPIIKPGIRVSDLNLLLKTSSPSSNGQVPAYVPAPFDKTINCTADIANGVVDILVSFAVTKTHWDYFGGVTLTMKNHFGTFDPSNSQLHSYNALIGINKSNAIIGGTPPRQQLAVIDAIRSISTGNYGPPDPQARWPYRIVMGTFAPAVDYVMAKKVMSQEMKVPLFPAIENYMLDFGYTAQERDAMTLVDVPNTTTVLPVSQRHASDAEVLLRCSGKSLAPSQVHIPFPASEKIQEITIYTMDGKLIRSIPVAAGAQAVRSLEWDGKTCAGSDAGAGAYVVCLRGAKSRRAGEITLRSADGR
jgi:hypothetical protein